MSPRLGACILMVALATALLVEPVPSLLAAEGKEAWDAYRILVDRNIFMRYRRAPRPDRPLDPQPAAPRPPAAPQFVLTGTARSGDGFIAFFEESRTGDTARVAVGQTVGEAVVTAITLDGVEVAKGETTRTIRIGDDLEGRAVERPHQATPSPPPAVPTPPAEEAKAAEPAGADDSPEAGPSPAEGKPADDPTEAEPPSQSGDADIAEILERMRQRREEELRR